MLSEGILEVEAKQKQTFADEITRPEIKGCRDGEMWTDLGSVREKSTGIGLAKTAKQRKSKFLRDDMLTV